MPSDTTDPMQIGKTPSFFTPSSLGRVNHSAPCDLSSKPHMDLCQAEAVHPNWGYQQALVIEQMYENKDDGIKRVHKIAWTMPEVSFWIFSGYELIFPLIFEWLKSLSIPQYIHIDNTWSIIDGISSLVIGATQLADQRTHRSLMTKIKGVINIGSGTQLLVFTILAASHAIPFAFAAAAAVDFILSLDPLLHSFRRLYSFSYWLDDSLAQLAKIKDEIEKLTEEKMDFDLWVSEEKNKGASTESFKEQSDWIIDQKQSRLERMIEEQHTICHAIQARLQLRGNTVNDSILEIIKQEPLQSDNLSEIEATIKNQLHDQLSRCAHETLIFCFALVGWTLFCIPGMQIPAAIIIGIAAVLYLSKHIKSLADFCQTPTKAMNEHNAVLSSEKDIKSFSEFEHKNLSMLVEYSM
ncbi:MAG: hypothetical protein Q8R24_05130 [Legionellaceae bacterium]|nr:hypothetical protein [Legionellaceae bacterium]